MFNNKISKAYLYYPMRKKFKSKNKSGKAGGGLVYNSKATFYLFCETENGFT
jgi:hypothetical protein